MLRIIHTIIVLLIVIFGITKKILMSFIMVTIKTIDLNLVGKCAHFIDCFD